MELILKKKRLSGKITHAFLYKTAGFVEVYPGDLSHHCLCLYPALFLASHQEKQLIMEQVKKQAVILHKQIVLTREWVSDRNYVSSKSKKTDP